MDLWLTGKLPISQKHNIFVKILYRYLWLLITEFRGLLQKTLEVLPASFLIFPLVDGQGAVLKDFDRKAIVLLAVDPKVLNLVLGFFEL